MTDQLSQLKLSAGYSQYNNVWFCACGRRLLRGEFLEMCRVEKVVRGRTKHVNQLVVKQGLKQCHYCARGLKA